MLVMVDRDVLVQRKSNFFMVLTLRLELTITELPWYLITSGASCFSIAFRLKFRQSTTSAKWTR